MLRRFLLCLFLPLALAACGADGPPEKPTNPGITLSGEAQIGVVVK